MNRVNRSNRVVMPAWLPWAVCAVAVIAAVWGWSEARSQRATALAARADAVNAGPNAQLQQQIATLRQSDQISRKAMLDLQDTLTERDEQIAALRADLDFYERFVSSDVQRRGLSVNAAHVQPQAANVWRFDVTLTQGREQAGSSRGTVTLAVEGSRAGKLERLDWAALRQKPDAPGIDYQLRYLQRVDGEFALPEGFVPTRLVVKLQPAQGKPVEAAFNWKDIVAQG